MRLPHHRETIQALRRPSPDEPWRMLVSGCLAGIACGVDGTTNGTYPAAVRLLTNPAVRPIPFCPEDHAMGTPRTTPDIHGGDGIAVLEGRARVLDEHGTDLTAAMLEGAQAMLERALHEHAELALLMDMSGACGSQVISDGARLVPSRRYRRGVGVATAMLLRAGIPVFSQRDFATHERLLERIDPAHRVDPQARDHHENEWYLQTFGDPA